MSLDLFAAMAAGVDPVALAELFRKPAWMADGLCMEHPEVEFVPRARVCRGFG